MSSSNQNYPGSGYICRKAPCRPFYPKPVPHKNNYRSPYTRTPPTYRPHAPERPLKGKKCVENKADEYNPNEFLPKKNELHTPACAHIKSLYNPFEIANANPKWPDGLANYSVGVRHLESKEVVSLIEDDSNMTDFLIILFPGTANWCIAVNQISQSTGKSNYSLAGVLGTNTSFNWSYSGHDITGMKEWSMNTDAFSAWRGVSYAMKLALISPTDSREGFYEAIRVERSTFQTSWGITGGDTNNNNGEETRGGVKLYPGYALPSTDSVINHFMGLNWQLNPTFSSGNLKTIDKNIFMLNPSKTINDFTEIRKIAYDYENLRFEEIYGERVVMADGTTQVDENKFTTKLACPLYENMATPWAETKNDQHTLISDAFDMILVRIHSTNAKIMISTVANQEFLVRENSSFMQYSTPAYADRDGLDKFMWSRKKFHRLPVHNETHTLAFGKPIPLEK